MDPTDDAFFREAKSQIRALSDGLLALERGDNGDGDDADGDDADEGVAVAELFRVAHSLKGSCRTHGLEEAGDLAHALEDVLDALRAGEVAPTPELVDDALAAVDVLEATVRDAAVGSGVEGDPEATRESLRATLDRVRAESPADADSSVTPGLLGDAGADPPRSGDDWDPADDDLSDDVVAALEETSEFDDLDSLLDGMDDPEDDEELDGWGMLGEESADEELSVPDDSEDAATPDEPASFFERTKAEMGSDDESIDSLQEDIDAVEFGEFDDEDNYTIEELMELEPDEETTPSGVADESAVEADESAAGTEPTSEAVADESASPEALGESSAEVDFDEALAPDADDLDSSPSDRPNLDPAAASLDPSPDSPDVSGESGEFDDAEAKDDSTIASDTSIISSDTSTSSSDSAGIAPDSSIGSESDPAESESSVDAADDPLGLADDDSVSVEADTSPPTEEEDGEVAAADAEQVEPEADADGADEETGTGTFVFGEPEDDAPEDDTSEDKSDIPNEDEESEVDDVSPDLEPGASDSAAAESDADPVSAADSTPDAESVPDADSLPDADTVPEADSLPDADSMPDADSVPEGDLGVDLSGDFGDDLSGVGDDFSADFGASETEMDVSVDEEMAAFESRFGDLLGEGPTDDDEEGAVFRSAVSTIEESSLDADQFPTADAVEGSGETGDFDRLQAMTVDVDTADKLLDVAEELSLSHLRLDEAVTPETDDAIREEVSNLLRIVTEYRRTVMDVRLMALETAIDTIPRTVRDVARAQDKEVDLVVNDADVELDRSILDRLRDPLVHLARNAVDHGIEPPEEREKAGKPREGTVEISAERVGDEVVIELADDGRGVDPEEVREQAIERGVVSPAEADRLSDSATYDLLFEPGFTTTEEVTDVSGRGVGMDVVNRTVADLNGTVTVESEPGAGTAIRLTVPVSIALTEVLFVEVEGRTFGIPMTAVEQITPTPPVETVDGRDVVRRSDLDLVGGLPEGVEAGDAYPHVDLREALALSEAGDERDDREAPGAPDDQIVWIRAETGRRAVRCDRVVASQEVVVRPYGDLLRDVPSVSGATTLGDGRAVNVLDVGSL